MVKNITKRHRVQEIQGQKHIGIETNVATVSLNELKTTSTTKNKQTKKLKKNE